MYKTRILYTSELYKVVVAAVAVVISNNSTMCIPSRRRSFGDLVDSQRQISRQVVRASARSR